MCVEIDIFAITRSQKRKSLSSTGYGTTPLMTDDDVSDDDDDGDGQDQQLHMQNFCHIKPFSQSVATSHSKITSMVELDT